MEAECFGKQFKHGVETLLKVDPDLRTASKILIALFVYVSMVSSASAIDLNSTTDLRYFPDSNLEFKVDTEGNLDAKGELDITDSATGTRIADFKTNQIEMFQPLSIQSSGPLSVANGIDLTGTGTNTIDSYSTLYLQTSSGSPTDIVLQPSGVTDIASNTTLRGDLDMDGNVINNIGGLQGCGNNQYVGGDGNCKNDQVNSVNKDLVAGSALNGGSNNVLPGSDSDVTINVDSSIAGDNLAWDSTNNEIDLGGSLYGDEDAQDAVGTIMTGSGATSVTYDDAGNAITISSTDDNTQLDDEAATSNVNINNNQLNSVNQLNFNGGAYIDEGTAEYGSIRLDGGESSNYGGISVQGNRDVVIGMTDADGSGFSTGAYDDDNNNWIWNYDGSSMDIRYNGNWKAQAEEYGLNVDTDGSSNSDGYRLDGNAALTTDGGWLRLNQDSNWNDRIYTPSVFRADGEIRTEGGLQVEGSDRHGYNGISSTTNNNGHLMLDSNGGNLYLNWDEGAGDIRLEGNKVRVDSYIDMNGNNINSVNQMDANEVSVSNSFQLPVGTDAY